MANKVVNFRQWELRALVDCQIADIANTFSVVLPPGALLESITADTVTAFNGTTNTINVADNALTPVVYVNAQDTKTVGRETVANIGAFYPAGAVLTVSQGQTGTATTGRVLVSIGYVILNRANENQR